VEFRYRAKTAAGVMEEGSLDADTLEAAARTLVVRGLFPVDVAPSDADGKPWWKQLRLGHGDGLRLGQQAMLARQLSDLLSAGVSLVSALTILEWQGDDPAVARRTGQLAEAVRQGRSVATALEEHRGTLPASLVAVIRAGEVGGALEHVFTSIADLLEAEFELRSKIRQALIYPGIVSVASALTLGVLFGFLIPRLSVLYLDMGQSLPAPTRLLLMAAEVTQTYGAFVRLALGGGFLALRALRRRSAALAERMARWMLTTPKLGDVVRHREIVQFSRTLGTLIGGGVPVLEALRLTARACGNASMAGQLDAVHQRVQQGASLSSALSGQPSFAGPLLTMIEVGERSGDLPAALERAAVFYGRGLATKLQNFVRFLEPSLIFLLAIVVGFIVFSMMLPILELNLAAQ
jgi:type II secretory pathway component PulF